MVEIAVVLPLLLMVILSVISSSILLHNKIAVTSAARQAARELSITGDAGKAKATFQAALQDAGVKGTAENTDFVFCEVTASEASVSFAVVYFQKPIVPWVDALLWPVGATVEGQSRPGSIPFHVRMISNRE